MEPNPFLTAALQRSDLRPLPFRVEDLSALWTEGGNGEAEEVRSISHLERR